VLILKFFENPFDPLSPCLKKVVILTQLQKMVPVAPLFDLGADFHVFYAKI